MTPFLPYNDTTCEYDANGNLIKKIVGSIVTSYVYNIEDRLTQVWSGEPETGTLTARYYYDPFGRRLWKEVSGIKTYYHYSDEGLTGEYDADGNEIKTYGYKPNSTWTTDPLFMKVGTEYYFYHNDHLGTPQKMTGVNGAVVWAAKYESFGRAVIEVDAVENNLRFAGQYFDGESGLCYNWHRYYDSGVGRYFRSDPIGFKGGINLYAYANQNSINLIDFEGKRALSKGCIQAMVKLLPACVDQMTGAWMNYWSYVKDCQSRWCDCKEKPDAPGCSAYKDCNANSLTMAAFCCAQNCEEWEKMASTMFSEKCIRAIIVAGYHCFKP